MLMRHSWPGNVRELENTLLRAAGARARPHPGRRTTSCSPARPARRPSEVLPLEDAVRQRLVELLDLGTDGVQDLYNTLISTVERPLIEVVLERAGGNQVKAADMLGINRNTLRKKITELGIPIRRLVRRRARVTRSPSLRSTPSSIRSTPAARRSSWRRRCWPAARACCSSA